jgi:hypothetical protein
VRIGCTDCAGGASFHDPVSRNSTIAAILGISGLVLGAVGIA